jgi:hypothetical protein
MTILGAVYIDKMSYNEAKFMLEQSLDILQSTISNLQQAVKDDTNDLSKLYRMKICRWKQATALSFFALLEHKQGNLEQCKQFRISFILLH